MRGAPTLALPGREDVFAIGDVASIEQDGRPVPGVAPAAKLPFHYHDRGSFAVSGRGAAVGVLLGQKLQESSPAPVH